MPPTKSWFSSARAALVASLTPIPHELNELDWKSSLSDNKGRLAEHLSAFANNAGGGFLVYGVDSTGQPTGISQSESEQVISRLANIARDALEPAQRIDYCTDAFEDKPLLFIHVEESAQKPVSLRGQGYEHAYMRTGGQTRKMSRNEITRAILQSRHLRYEELEAIACPTDKIADYLDGNRLAQLLGVPILETPESLLDMLVNQKMIYRSGDRCSITNLGALAAARDLKQFPGKERFPVRVIKYRGKSRTDAEHENEFANGYAVGFQELVRHILAQLPTNEIIRDALRKTVPVYPEISVRELTANALIHRDFLNTASNPMVEIFVDRMEITNPGRLLPTVKIDRLIDSAPESRNELFASTMRRMGICEERGSGIDRALIEIEIYGLPPVEFEEGENYFRVTLFHPRTFKQMTPTERLRACYQHCCLRYVSGERMTSASLRQRLGLGSRQTVQAWKIVSEAMRKHLIRLSDPHNKSRKFASYVPYWA